LPENRIPNLIVNVDAIMEDSTDWSVLGDWIGAQRSSEWKMPWGPMPVIRGLPENPSFEMMKALTAAAANHGCPMLWIEEEGVDLSKSQSTLIFNEKSLAERYLELAPKGVVDLVVIGCPQASIGEVRATAAAVRTQMELGSRIPGQRLWVFTSSYNFKTLSLDGTIDLLEEAGALVLKDTCPEVTPYNRERYNHLLTNSLKAEHYLTSGLNKMPTSVSTIEECVAVAFDPNRIQGKRPTLEQKSHSNAHTAKTHQLGETKLSGSSLPSQSEWDIKGKALVTDVPITYLGYVNRDTGIIEDPGHPLDGIAIEDSILIYPKGSGSTVAPYVLMGLIYTGKGPKAIINRDVCPLSMPAASLLGVPYATGFDIDPCMEINSGDEIHMELKNGRVSLEVTSRIDA
jgi:predicted aconitase with swiveling domain